MGKSGDGNVQLNKQQQMAVDHNSGPLLVVAGAGTGKTTVIVQKINRLLDEGVSPRGILAVTFTEKAASEMLDRVINERTGLVAEIEITTFNSFGESLLREFGSHIGIGRNFKLLSEQAQIVFVRERIDKFNLDYFLPLANLPDAIIEDILGLFSLAKQHLVSPTDFIKYASSIEINDEASKEEKRQYVELADAYKTYTSLCRAENVIDYDDQIFLVVELLQKRPNIRALLKDRFHTIFIDEFQDTNPMQSRLIDLIANDSQNIVVVGDDDQSIYGFRGATLSNILSFKDRYPDSQQVALTENFRSHQAILDAAYKLIQNNNPHRLESTLSIDKRLTGKPSGPSPVVKRFNKLNEEIEWLAQDIEARVSSGESPGNIAILTRRRQTANAVHDALERSGIEHNLIGQKQDLYKHPVVRMLCELCRTLAEPHNNESLHHTLTSDIFGIPNEEIAHHSAIARAEHGLLESYLQGTKDKQIVKAMASITKWRKYSSSAPVGRLIYRVISESGYKDRLLAQAQNDDDSAFSIQVLAQYFDTLREFESIAIQPTTSQYLVSLPALKSAGETTDDGTAEIATDRVNIMTVHKAKGLEWNTVYIPDCTEMSFPTKNLPTGLVLPSPLQANTTSPADEHLAEERRLMYVALTRARNNVVISFSDHSKTNAVRKPSRFIDEMFDAGMAEKTTITLTGNEQQSLLDPSETNLAKPELPTSIYDGEKVRLSVSQATTLLDCPLDFYYKYILRAPEDPSPKTTYGTQLHHLFQIINQDAKNNNLRSLDVYLKELDSSWDRSGYASKKQQERAHSQATDTLKRFYENAGQSKPPLLVEESFSVDLVPEGITLRGRYDVIIENEGIEIRDYKTSTSVKTPEKAKQRATASKQLTMYALAWQLTHDELPDRLSLHFVDTDMIGSVRKTTKGIDGLRKRLDAAATNLRQGKFPAGTQKHEYCIHPSIAD